MAPSSRPAAAGYSECQCDQIPFSSQFLRALNSVGPCFVQGWTLLPSGFNLHWDDGLPAARIAAANSGFQTKIGEDADECFPTPPDIHCPNVAAHAQGRSEAPTARACQAIVRDPGLSEHHHGENRPGCRSLGAGALSPFRKQEGPVPRSAPGNP